MGQRAPRVYWLLGNCMTVLADRSDTAGRYDLIEANKPPGNRTPPHRHSRYMELTYVIEGRHTVWIDGREVVVGPGEHIAIPVGVEHVVAVNGEAPARTLLVTSPSGFADFIAAGGTPDTGAPTPDPTPVELERVIRAAIATGDESLNAPES